MYVQIDIYIYLYMYMYIYIYIRNYKCVYESVLVCSRLQRLAHNASMQSHPFLVQNEIQTRTLRVNARISNKSQYFFPNSLCFLYLLCFFNVVYRWRSTGVKIHGRFSFFIIFPSDATTRLLAHAPVRLLPLPPLRWTCCPGHQSDPRLPARSTGDFNGSRDGHFNI